MKIHEDCFLSYRADTIKSHFYYFQFQMVITKKQAIQSYSSCILHVA